MAKQPPFTEAEYARKKKLLAKFVTHEHLHVDGGPFDEEYWHRRLTYERDIATYDAYHAKVAASQQKAQNNASSPMPPPRLPLHDERMEDIPSYIQEARDEDVPFYIQQARDEDAEAESAALPDREETERGEGESAALPTRQPSVEILLSEEKLAIPFSLGRVVSPGVDRFKEDDVRHEWEESEEE